MCARENVARNKWEHRIEVQQNGLALGFVCEACSGWLQVVEVEPGCYLKHPGVVDIANEVANQPP